MSSIDIKETNLTIYELENSTEVVSIWESSIILSQFFMLNQKIIANKNIIDCGCGTGMAGI